MGTHVIVVGSVEAGFKVYGPFGSGLAAFNFAKANMDKMRQCNFLKLRSLQEFVDTFNPK